MGNILIPLGGAGGKNRGNVAVLGDSTPFTKTGEIVSLPLPAGNYKKSVSNPRTNYGDGKNSELTISKGLLKQMAINAFGIASITNFSAAMYAHKQVRLTWARPSQGLWSGVHFVFKYGSMPDGIYDGFTFWDSADVHYETTRPLQEGLLYIRAYNYVTTNEGRWYDDGAVSATIRVSGISGSVTFGAGAGTWTVPEGVRRIRYILVGHGGDGGRILYSDCSSSGGGGGYLSTGYMDVSPGQALSWVVPTATGQATVLNGITANSGGTGSYGTYQNKNLYGGDGGSGGGAGTPRNGKFGSGCGGTDGGDGQECWFFAPALRKKVSPHPPQCRNVGGTGQHTSTRGFNGVLYSGGGGGGGGGEGKYPELGAGLGGPGGGGNPVTGSNASDEGAKGTDGLGGGGGGVNSYLSQYDIANRNPGGYPGGRGGTGCIYIAWGSLMNDGD